MKITEFRIQPHTEIAVSLPLAPIQWPHSQRTSAAATTPLQLDAASPLSPARTLDWCFAILSVLNTQ
jgi:hypothetical protein